MTSPFRPTVFAALLLASQSAHARSADDDLDRNIASIARSCYWDHLATNAESYFDLLPEPAPDGTRSPSSVEIGNWPFDGLAPAPGPVTRSGGALSSPAATVEWRRGEDGELREFFAQGPKQLIAIARGKKPAEASALGGAGPVARRAREPWKRNPSFKPEDFAEGFCCTSVGERTDWCSAWADCYPTGVEGLFVVLTLDVGRDELRVAVVDTKQPGDQPSAGPIEFSAARYSGPTGGPILLAQDFDANGTIDYCVGEFTCGCGLSICHLSAVFVLTDGPSRTARITQLDSDGASFIDIDDNGRLEILARRFVGCRECTDGKPHNFWVTSMLGFQDLGIVDLKGVHRVRHEAFEGTFPAFEWLSFDPKDRFRPLLTDAQKEQMGQSGFPPYRRGPKPGASALVAPSSP